MAASVVDEVDEAYEEVFDEPAAACRGAGASTGDWAASAASAAGSAKASAVLRRRCQTPPPLPRPGLSPPGSSCRGGVSMAIGGGSSAGATKAWQDDTPRTAEQPWHAALSAVPVQRGITMLVLVFGAMLVLLGPSRWCFTEDRADIVDQYRSRSHASERDGPDQCHVDALQPGNHGRHASPPPQVAGRELAEVVSVGISGLLMSLAVVLGGIGADIPGRGIFAMGTASLAGYSVSLGFSTFLVESTKEEFAMSQLEEERAEVRHMPQEEVSEMVCHYQKRGLSATDAKLVAGVLSKYEDFWVEHMMVEELGIQLPRGGKAAVAAGAAACASLLLCGTLPLLGVACSLALGRLRGPSWYRPQFATYVALTMSGLALVLLGVFASRASGSRTPGVNGMLMLLNGCGTALMAFSVGQACLSFFYDGDALTPPPGKDGVRSGSPLISPSGGPTQAAGGLAPAATAITQPAVEEWTTLAWPAFRDRFRHEMCYLWAGVCIAIVSIQGIKGMGYASLRVFLYGWLTCVTTGLGALPFLFIRADSVSERPLAFANAAAGGMMLAASCGMLHEAHEHCGPFDWQILLGLLVGALFLRWSESLHAGGDEEGEDNDLMALHTAFVERRHFRKAMLIFTVMFCHSAAEGIAVGVAFSKQLRAEFGLYVTLLLAVHNIPEGLAVALVLVPRGVSAPLASFIAVLTSVPQPLLAVAAFLFVDTFAFLLPLGLAFAAGAMIYVCVHELLNEAADQLGCFAALLTTAASFTFMAFAIVALQELTGF